MVDIARRTSLFLARKIKQVHENVQKSIFNEFHPLNATGRYIIDLSNSDERKVLKR